MNAVNFDEYKDQASVFLGIMILDAMANEFIASQRNTEGLEKAVLYTENWKSLGLGVLGFASYLQSKMVPWNSFEAELINTEIFSQLQQESILASQYIYEYGVVGKKMVGHGQAHSHLNAIAPNLSSSVLAGQVSQGIEPWLANAFMQDTASGSMVRINPQFLKLIEGKGLDVKKVTKAVIENKGSIKGLNKWFTEEEIEVFATAFEIPQERLIDLAAARQKFIDQGQSLNLFFSSEEDPKYIAKVHQKALLNPWIKGLYYCRSESGVQASKNVACESCAS
jgi:ribonucleoside-diphosphate reductase alpha chain